MDVFHNIWSKVKNLPFELGMDKMTQDEMQKALWTAAQKGDKEKIRMLIVAGADVTAEDDLGRTALNIASQYGQADAYKTLLAAREMQALQKAGITPETQEQPMRKGNAKVA
ncbi:MAG TPA: ankyrin repeat domain-containing protein [Alphaproteobacteria bacterium]